MYNVFITHSHADNAICDQYANALKRCGLDVWYDIHSLEVGTTLSDEIQQQLMARGALVVMCSPIAIESFWVNLEVNMFLHLQSHDPMRIMIPVKIAPCDLPPKLIVNKYIDATQIPFHETIRQLALRLQVPENAIPALGEDASDAPAKVIYVSHVRTGPDPFTSWMVRDLTRYQLTVSLDKGGTNDTDPIADAMRASDWVLLVATPESVLSPEVRAEMAVAMWLYQQQQIQGILLFKQKPFDSKSLPSEWPIKHEYEAGSNYSAALGAMLRDLHIML